MHLNITYTTSTLINHQESQVSNDFEIPASMNEFRDALYNIVTKYFGEFTNSHRTNYPGEKSKKDNYSYSKNDKAFIGITEIVKKESPNWIDSVLDMLLGDEDNETTTYKLRIQLKVLHPELYSDAEKYNFKGELNTIINSQKDKDKTGKLKTNFDPHIYPSL